MKNLGRGLTAVALCVLVWFVHPAREQVNQLEDQLSSHYSSANFLLRDTLENLLKWNFSQPLSIEDEGYLRKLSNDLNYTSDMMFSGDVVHEDWKNRIYDIQKYIDNYVFNSSLSQEEVEDLHQALQATRFISMDLGTSLDDDSDFYDAMHDEQHEMVDKIKNRLSTQY